MQHDLIQNGTIIAVIVEENQLDFIKYLYQKNNINFDVIDEALGKHGARGD